MKDKLTQYLFNIKCLLRNKETKEIQNIKTNMKMV